MNDAAVFIEAGIKALPRTLQQGIFLHLREQGLCYMKGVEALGVFHPYHSISQSRLIADTGI